MIPAIVIVSAALGIVFLYSSVLRRKNIHAILEMRTERSKLEKELEDALSDRRQLLTEVEELDVKLKGVQSNTVSLTGEDDPSGFSPSGREKPKTTDPGALDKAAANWLLKSGQISLEQYEKVEAYIARSTKEMNFLSACLILGLIDKEAADQARQQAES